MANIKSQKKRALTNLKRQNAKAGQKSELKTAVKKVLAAVAEGNKEAAVEAFNKANKSLDKAIVSGIRNKNYVARQKSRLAKAVNSIQ
ncbi:MAG: 30S ribosomal protein S20 [Solobacterium sp.]|jgi:small subunit ribosomal protein S20|nr:30S ribosomal protein S20 [Solobacterium sp.]